MRDVEMSSESVREVGGRVNTETESFTVLHV